MSNLERIKFDPRSVYKHPRDVLKDSHLSRKEKIEVLKSWAYDEKEYAVAEEENMQKAGRPEEDNLLGEILRSLIKLEDTEKDESPSNKKTR